MRSVWLATFALVMLTTAAMAQPQLPDPQNLDESVQEAQATTDGLAAELIGTATDLGDSVANAGDAIGAGLARIGDALGAMLRAIGTGSAAFATALTGAGAATATGIAVGVAAIGTAAGATTSFVGGTTGAVTLVTIGGIGAALGTIGATAWALIQPLRPEAMPKEAFVATAAASGAATAGVAGWGIWSLLQKYAPGVLGLAGFSRINDHDVLEHPMRAQLMEAIRADPGIHASQLARDADIGWGTVTHHLQKMEKARLVAVRTVNNQRCYFENGGAMPRDQMALAGVLKVKTAANIVDYVEHHPMSSQKTVAQAIGISAALVSFHVRKLIAAGALEKVRSGKEMLLAPTQAMRGLMAHEHAATPTVEAAAASS